MHHTERDSLENRDSAVGKTDQEQGTPMASGSKPSEEKWGSIHVWSTEVIS